MDLTSFERILNRNPLQNTLVRREIWQEYNILSTFQALARRRFPGVGGDKTQVTDLHHS
jgi:hypothetical protein